MRHRVPGARCAVRHYGAMEIVALPAAPVAGLPGHGGRSAPAGTVVTR